MHLKVVVDDLPPQGLSSYIDFVVVFIRIVCVTSVIVQRKHFSSPSSEVVQTCCGNYYPQSVKQFGSKRNAQAAKPLLPHAKHTLYSELQCAL